MSLSATDSTYVSDAGRRRLVQRMQQLDAKLQLIRPALDDPERSAEMVQEHMRVIDELERIAAFLDQSPSGDDFPDDPHVVEMGDTVGIRLEDGTEEHYVVVHPIEAALAERRISVESPLGQAVLGRSIGDVVDVTAPAGPYRCTITSAAR